MRLAYSLLALLVGGACTSSDPGDPATNDNPDPLASRDLPNECMTNHWKDLQGNVNVANGWSGPVSTYRAAPIDWPRRTDWSPLQLETGISSGAEGEQTFIHLSGSERLPTECEMLDLFERSSEGAIDTDSYLQHESVLVHDFPTFAFPTADQLPISTDPIVVASDSRLVVTYEKPTKRSDGTYDYSFREVVKTQSWPLSNMTCKTPFTITPSWTAAAGSLPPFCKDANGTSVCLAYTAQYTADECRFEILDGQFELRDGRSFRANLAGYFTQVVGGYRLAITNVEFLRP